MFQSSPIPEDGRYQWDSREPLRRLLFQSSPIPEDGRYPATVELWLPIIAFQSSPIPEDGRYAERLHRIVRKLRVSILAHPGGWALLGAGKQGAREGGVSILAHPGGWALRTRR